MALPREKGAKHMKRTDVRRLPEFAFEHRMPIWWGTAFFMVIEGSAFLMTLTAYAYLASQNPDWPFTQYSLIR